MTSKVIHIYRHLIMITTTFVFIFDAMKAKISSLLELSWVECKEEREINRFKWLINKMKNNGKEWKRERERRAFSCNVEHWLHLFTSLHFTSLHSISIQFTSLGEAWSFEVAEEGDRYQSEFCRLFSTFGYYLFDVLAVIVIIIIMIVVFWRAEMVTCCCTMEKQCWRNQKKKDDNNSKLIRCLSFYNTNFGDNIIIAVFLTC